MDMGTPKTLRSFGTSFYGTAFRTDAEAVVADGAGAASWKRSPRKARRGSTVLGGAAVCPEESSIDFNVGMGEGVLAKNYRYA